jgi:DNA-binding transcriptional MerR regulator
MYPINVVEKETGISKYLLRMWERRYSFPKPERDPKGERLYSAEELKKLILVKDLMQEGYRPSKIMDKNVPELLLLQENFKHKKTSKVSTIVIVTNAELHESVLSTLKNQEVGKVITVSNHNDLQQLNF